MVSLSNCPTFPFSLLFLLASKVNLGVVTRSQHAAKFKLLCVHTSSTVTVYSSHELLRESVTDEDQMQHLVQRLNSQQAN